MLKEFKSSSSDKTYTVDTEQATCTCPGFNFKGACRHLYEAGIVPGVTHKPKAPEPQEGEAKLLMKALSPETLKRVGMDLQPAKKNNPYPSVMSNQGDPVYVDMEQFSRLQVGRYFLMRDFLFLSKAQFNGAHNFPEDDPDQVVRSALDLCEKVLDPIIDWAGKIHVTYGYSNRTNTERDWTDKQKAKKTSSQPHQWDRGTFGKQVFARVDIVPEIVTSGKMSREDFGLALMDNLDIDLLMMWEGSNTFCVSVGPKPRRVFLEWVPKGKGTSGGNCRYIRGEHYWKEVYPSLPPEQRPRFHPSTSNGRMFWD